MKPDRFNYEIWLTDWLDGSLGRDQTEKLMAFLEENPDIKEEADFLAIAHLSPGKDFFPGKESLKKKAAALTSGQVELLSVAYLENDLDHDHESELHQCLSHNPESKKIFDSIQRTKLIPSRNEYEGKKSLRKLTAGTRALRISIASLSAAATITLLILAYTFGPSLLRKNNTIAEQIIVTEASQAEPLIVRTKAFHTPAAIYQISKPVPGTPDIQAISEVLTDSSDMVFEKMPEHRVTKFPSIAFTPRPLQNEYSLIALNISFSEKSYYDDRNAFTRFLARNFREKILGDDNFGDAPIKPMEVAEAGIEGLNKLLGWEMSLVAVNDNAGELKSVYFDSKMLKFNAPVKKNESVE
jgi:hypothetical protein